jgi:hypothetical protein
MLKVLYLLNLYHSLIKFAYGKKENRCTYWRRYQRRKWA